MKRLKKISQRSERCHTFDASALSLSHVLLSYNHEHEHPSLYENIDSDSAGSCESSQNVSHSLYGTGMFWFQINIPACLVFAQNHVIGNYGNNNEINGKSPMKLQILVLCSYMWLCVSAGVESRHNSVYFRKSLWDGSTAGAFLYPLESLVGTHKYGHTWKRLSSNTMWTEGLVQGSQTTCQPNLLCEVCR